jgi:hypothetical protein
LAAGGYHSLGLKSDGSILAWGGNWNNQCNVPSPNTGFVALAAGGGHSLALQQDSSIVAWGYNNRGKWNVPSPNTGFVAVSAGWAHSLAIREVITNAVPVSCIVGGDRVVEAGVGCEVRVVLDGSCSSDADSTDGTNDDINDFDWYEVVDACEPNSDIFLGSGEVIECNLPLGEHVVALVVTDSTDANDSNEVVITVVDTTGPVIVLNGSGTVVLECGVDSYVEEGAVATDLCDGNVPVVTSGDTVDTLACGTYVVTYNATDSSGNAAQATRTVIVQDTTAPEITCPGDITVLARWPWGAVVTFEATATDLCDSQVEVVSSPASGSVFAPGETTVVCTATDESGNSSSCSFTVMVVAPVAMAMNFTPGVLNPRSEGNLMKAHFVLPEGYEIGDVDVNTPAVLQPLGIESEYINVFVDRGRWGEPGVEIGFDRRSFCEAVGDFGPGEVTVSVRLTNGIYVYGTGTVRIIERNMEYLGVMVSYWLEDECDVPDWCERSDVDENGMVDLVDFALINGCCVEVITE